MEPINSIFSFRALIVLLLIVDSTLSAVTTASHGQACNAKEHSTDPAEQDKAKKCQPDDDLLCFKKGTGKLGSASVPDIQGGEQDPRDTEDGICMCTTDGEAWNGKACGPPGTGGGAGSKSHGEACSAVGDCKEPFKCGIPGTPAAVVGEADIFGVEWTAAAGKPGKCACKDGKAEKMGKCEPVEAKKKHGDECAGLEECMDPFKCGVPGTAVPGKGDNFGDEWTAGKKGKCACKEEKAEKDGKCELPTAPAKKKHGDECAGLDECMDPFKCGVPGTAVPGKGDNFGDEWTAGKKGKCACKEEKAEKDGKCELPTAPAKKKHGDECAGLDECMDPFKCGVPGTAEAGKGDNFGDEWTAGKKGKCACKDKKAKKDDKCEVPVSTGGDTATSRSARIIYQSMPLQIIFSLAIRCLLYCSS